MVRIAIFVLFIGLFYFLVRSYFLPTREEECRGESMEMVQDPNCQIYLPRAEGIERLILGKTHHFCSEKCADIYEKSSAES